MAFRLLRRKYQDSYLSEIGQAGTNGCLVRSVSGPLLARASFAVKVTFPAHSYTGRFPDVNSGEIVWETHTVACGQTATYYPINAYPDVAYNLHADTIPRDCRAPVALRGISGSTQSDAVLEESGVEYPRKISFAVRNAYIPYWGTLDGTMPSYDGEVSQAGEGIWALAVDASYSGYVSHSGGSGWVYAPERQHRIGAGLSFDLGSVVWKVPDSSSTTEIYRAYHRAVETLFGNVFAGVTLSFGQKFARYSVWS